MTRGISIFVSSGLIVSHLSRSSKQSIPIHTNQTNTSRRSSLVPSLRPPDFVTFTMKFELTNFVIAVAVASSPMLASGKPFLHRTTKTTTAHTLPFGVVSQAAIDYESSSSTTTFTKPTTMHHDILSIRGGAVHESQTLSDLESRIQSAALQNKLTVVDFTATWCGPVRRFLIHSNEDVCIDFLLYPH